jgi:hypothetical protein
MSPISKHLGVSEDWGYRDTSEMYEIAFFDEIVEAT